MNITICRTCLKESVSLFDLYMDFKEDIGKKNMKDLLVYLGCIEENEINFPRSICDECAAMAFDAYNFRQICKKSTHTLLSVMNLNKSRNEESNNIISKENTISDDKDKEMHRKEHHLSNSKQILNDCNKEYENESTIVKVTNKTAIHTCANCRKEFFSLEALNGHISTHTVTSHNLCSICGKLFTTKGGLRQHLKSHNSQKLHACTICNNRYRRLQSLRDHQRVAHSNNRFLYQCEYCNKNFTSKSTLQAHRKGHLGLNKLKCEICQKVFTRLYYLKKHVLATHEGKEPNQKCPVDGCNKKYSTKTSIRIHLMHAHSDEKHFLCEYCAKAFSSKSNLQQHLLSHANLIVTCEICHIKFANLRTLRKHLETHKS